MSQVRVLLGEPNKRKHMEEDEWYYHFVDDPCDDISGPNLHLWFEIKD